MQQTIRKMTSAILGILIAMTLVSLESRAAQLTAEPVLEAEVSGSAEYEETGAGADPVTEQLLEEYRLILGAYLSDSGNSFEEELLQFPESYREKLRQLHAAHPSWGFAAVNTGIDWAEAVAMESRSYRAGTLCYSLLPRYASKLFLSRKSTDYDINTGDYINKDGSTWVSASEAAVAYYLDPRNFLTENSIFQFEAFDYEEKYQTLQGVEAVLNGTDLSHSCISYYTTNGTVVNTTMTYGEAIFAAGVKYGISPITLAVKIKQETGASLSHGSISGRYSYNGVSYQGYYNYYNVAANAVSPDQGSAIANGLIFAMGGADGSGITYGRPWISPLRAIDGGAEHLAERFLNGGRNTIYFKKFNTVAEPYFEGQYMQNLHGAVSEGNMAYLSYAANELTDSAFVFFIPVYENMPASGSEIAIQKTVRTGKTVSRLNLRSGPSVDEPILAEIPERELVTVGAGAFNNHPENVEKQLYDPYWMQVQYGDIQGYSAVEFLKMSVDFSLEKGERKQLSVSCPDSTIYFETSDPAVAQVDSTGTVTGINKGICMIYAFNGSGTRVDCVGVCVDGMPVTQLKEVKNAEKGIEVTWQSLRDADGYYVYRKTAGSSWTRIAQVSDGRLEKYSDATAVSGVNYTYTVKAYSGTAVSGYDRTGLSILCIAPPALKPLCNTSAGVQVSWQRVSGAEGYYIYRKTESEGWKKIGTVTGANTEKYVDKTAEAGGTYSYTVKGYAGSTMGGHDSKGKSILRLAVPVLVQPMNTEKGIQVKWEQTAGAAGYRVLRKSDSGEWERIAELTGGTTVFYNDRNVQHGKTYTYTVRAFNGNSQSSYNSTGKSWRHISEPELKALTNYSSGVQVNWKQLANVDGYHIYRKTGSESWTKIATVKGGSTDKYIDRTTAAGITYAYTVKGYVGSTVGAYDKTGKSILRLENPVLVQPVNTEKGIQVKWEKTKGATGYRVYRKTVSGGWERIAEVTGADTLFYNDQKAQHGSTYIYTVRALNGADQSSYDTNGKSWMYLGKPELIGLANTTLGVQVNWKQMSDADGYHIYRKSGNGSWTKVGTVKGSSMETFVDRTAVKGETYAYTVKGYVGSTVGAYDKTGKSIRYTI